MESPHVDYVVHGLDPRPDFGGPTDAYLVNIAPNGPRVKPFVGGCVGNGTFYLGIHHPRPFGDQSQPLVATAADIAPFLDFLLP